MHRVEYCLKTRVEMRACEDGHSESYKAVFIRNVIGQFEFVKGDYFRHPLLASSWRIGMNVHAFGHFWISLRDEQKCVCVCVYSTKGTGGTYFACDHPARVVKFIAAIIGRHDVH